MLKSSFQKRRAFILLSTLILIPFVWMSVYFGWFGHTKTTAWLITIILLTVGFACSIPARYLREITYFRVVIELTVTPFLFGCFIFLLMSLCFVVGIQIPSLLILLGLVLAVSFFTLKLISRREIWNYATKRHIDFLETVRVVLDYTEAVYWCLASIVLVLVPGAIAGWYTKDFTSMIKLILMAFMLQTRVTKAVVGGRLLKLKKQEKLEGTSPMQQAG